MTRVDFFSGDDEFDDDDFDFDDDDFDFDFDDFDFDDDDDFAFDSTYDTFEFDDDEYDTFEFDDDEFDNLDDIDFDFDDDEDFFSDGNEYMPYRVLKHYINVLLTHGSVQETLATLCKVKGRRVRHELASEVTETWAKRGDYNSAISAAYLSRSDIDQGRCWVNIANIAIEKDEFDQIEAIIVNHGATRARALMYWHLLWTLLEFDEEALTVLAEVGKDTWRQLLNKFWNRHLDALQQVRSPVLKLNLLIRSASLCTLVDEHTKSAFDILSQRFDDLSDAELKEINAIKRTKISAHDVDQDSIALLYSIFDEFLDRNDPKRFAQYMKDTSIDGFFNF